MSASEGESVDDEEARGNPLIHEPVVDARYGAIMQTPDDLVIQDGKVPEAWIASDTMVTLGGEIQ